MTYFTSPVHSDLENVLNFNPGCKIDWNIKEWIQGRKNITFTFSKEKYPFKEFLKLHFTGNLGSIMSHILNHGLGDNQYSILKAERHTKKVLVRLKNISGSNIFVTV